MEMISFFSEISLLVGATLAILLILLFIFFAIVLARLAKNGKKSIGKYTKICGISIISIFLVSLATIQLMKNTLLKETEGILANPELTVSVNESVLDQADIFAKDFLDRTTIKHTGSEPEKVFKVLISNASNRLEFEFKRDSRDKNLYWVYYPDYHFFGNLGFVATQSFR